MKLLQALDETLENQKPTLHKLSEETKALEKNMLPDVGKTYRQEFDDAQGKWNKVKTKVSRDLRSLEEIIPRLRDFKVNREAGRSLGLIEGTYDHRLRWSTCFLKTLPYSWFHTYFMLKLGFTSCLSEIA